MNTSTTVFLQLLRGGLWEQGTSLASYGDLDFSELLRLGEEQSVLGLVTAGLEQVSDVQVRKSDVVPLLQRVIATENRNSAMNAFISSLVGRLEMEGITAVLVKGQGIAQCYERPQWRAPGDIDFLLNAANYEKAKNYLSFVSQSVHEENPFDKHYSVEIDEFCVELHGTMRGLLTKRADDLVDAVQEETFTNREFRNWEFGGASITLPSPDNDVIFVFAHILKHFFHYGIGLRQICDWSRLLWTYRSDLDLARLEARLRKAGLMTEWRAFGALAVSRLGMPEEAMPFYSPDKCWKRKADRILSFVLETGNFGHNREKSSLTDKPFVIRKLLSLWQHTGDTIRHFFIFPQDALRIWCRLVGTGLGAVTEKKK